MFIFDTIQACYPGRCYIYEYVNKVRFTVIHQAKEPYQLNPMFPDKRCQNKLSLIDCSGNRAQKGITEQVANTILLIGLIIISHLHKYTYRWMILLYSQIS